MNVFLGVDVGGSKTHALLIDEHSQLLSLGLAGGGNPENVGISGLAAAMHAAVQDAEEKFKNKRLVYLSAGFGVAGCDWDEDRAAILEVIQTLKLNCPVKLENDCVPALWAANLDGQGIVVSAGTGNNVRGQWKDGRQGRISGNSIINGEFGGASEMVFLAIQQLSYIWTRRQEVESSLVKKMLDLTHAKNLPDLLAGLIRGRYEIPADAAPIILQAAKNEDPVAVQVVLHSASELALSVLAVARQLEICDQPFDLVMSGSLLQKNQLYREVFMDCIHRHLPQANGIRLETQPVVGALLMGVDAYKRSGQANSVELPNYQSIHELDDLRIALP